MEKRIESSNSIFRREIDALHSARSKLREENRSFRDQLELKENNEISPPLPPMNDSSQIISAGSTEMISLPTTAPILASSLLSPIIIYPILTLLLIAIIWLVVGKKLWNLWKKSDRFIQTSDLHLRAYPRPGYMIGGRKRSPHDQIEYRN